MSTASVTTQIAPQPAVPASAPAPLLISLTSLSREALDRTLTNLLAAFPNESLLVVAPDSATQVKPTSSLILLSYIPAAHTQTSWVLTAADFLNTWKLASEHHATVSLLLGPEAQSLSTETLRALVAAVTSGRDLALPRYQLGPRDGLVNSAILYPVSRALFGSRARFPLAIDIGLSPRMTERLATAAQRFTAANQNNALLWPVAEAAVGNCSIAEVPSGDRIVPHPTDADLNTLLGQILGSLFSDIEAKAAFWQRARLPQPFTPQSPTPASPMEDVSTTITQMLDSFRLAYTNLHEIWALVLPPHSLLGLKKLSQLPPESFLLPDALWVRIVYDFILAYRLRTLNRGHLLGALTPLYLAWAASYLRLTTSGSLAPEQHVEQLASAFETDKPYLVSRWRWPDRFNP